MRLSAPCLMPPQNSWDEVESSMVHTGPKNAGAGKCSVQLVSFLPGTPDAAEGPFQASEGALCGSGKGKVCENAVETPESPVCWQGLEAHQPCIPCRRRHHGGVRASAGTVWPLQKPEVLAPAGPWLSHGCSSALADSPGGLQTNLLYSVTLQVDGCN
jgi:hypothetical protein